MVESANKPSSLLLAFWRIEAHTAPAVFAEPLLLFLQPFLIYALHMEPLQLAECVVTHHHLPEGRAFTVTVFWFVRVIVPISLLRAPLASYLLASFLAILFSFVHTSLGHFLLQPLSRLVNDGIQFFSNSDLLVPLVLDGRL